MQAGRFHVSSCDLIDAGRALEFIFYVTVVKNDHVFKAKDMQIIYYSTFLSLS